MGEVSIRILVEIVASRMARQKLACCVMGTSHENTETSIIFHCIVPFLREFIFSGEWMKICYLSQTQQILIPLPPALRQNVLNTAIEG